MTSQADVPACPWCHTAKRVYLYGERDFFCNGCKRLFDDDPDEGGDYGYEPDYRIRREETREQRRRAKR